MSQKYQADFFSRIGQKRTLAWVTLRVSNEFEGKTVERVQESNTLSTLFAEQEAIKAGRKKFRDMKVVTIEAM